MKPIVEDYTEIEKIIELIPDVKASGMKLTFAKQGMLINNHCLYALNKEGNEICFYTAREIEIYLAGARDGALGTAPSAKNIWPVTGD